MGLLAQPIRLTGVFSDLNAKTDTFSNTTIAVKAIVFAKAGSTGKNV